MSAHPSLRIGVGAAVAVVAAVVGIGAGAVASRTTTASAADLAITARAGVHHASTRCTSTALAVEPSATSGATTTEVAVTGLTAADLTACAGAIVTLRIVGSTGNQLAWATGPAAATLDLDVSFPTAAAVSALVDVDGFAVPTAWSTPPPERPTPAVGCTVYGSDGAPASDYACTVAVTTYSWQFPPYSGGFVYTVTRGGQGAAVPAGGYAEFTVGLPDLPATSWADATVVSNNGSLTIESFDRTTGLVTGRHTAGWNGNLNFSVTIG